MVDLNWGRARDSSCANAGPAEQLPRSSAPLGPCGAALIFRRKSSSVGPSKSAQQEKSIRPREFSSSSKASASRKTNQTDAVQM
jgi:hypothetical protein